MIDMPQFVMMIRDRGLLSVCRQGAFVFVGRDIY